MQENLKEKINVLIKLQEIENEAALVKNKLDGFPNQIEAVKCQFIDLDKEYKEEEKILDEINKKYRSFDSEVQSNHEKAKQKQFKLNSIKTNKEYQSLLKEIDDLTAKNSKIEDEMLELLETIETTRQHLKVRKKEIEELKIKLDKDKNALETEIEKYNQKLMQLEQNKEQILEIVDPKLLKLFKTVRQMVGAVAVASVSNEICYGCHMNIPPQLYNELQRWDKVFACPHCQRIIYWKESPDRLE